MTEATAIITYASIMSRETARIALMIVALNDLDVKSGNILNAYVQMLMYRHLLQKRCRLLWVLSSLKMPE